MTKRVLEETSGKPQLVEGGRFRAVLITPGKGSSGTYSEEVLQRDAQTAFPPGTKSWINHPTEANPTRDPRDLFGIYPDGGVYEEGVGIVGEFLPMPHYREFAEAVAPHAALSIYALGESDVHGNVTALLPGVQNSVDLVGYPGRPGSGLTQMYESARAAFSEERTATLAGEKKETKMTPEQEALLREALAAIASFVAESKKSATAQAKETADADTVSTAVSEARKATVTALEAVNAADLPDAIRKNLVKTVEDGETNVAPLIEAATAAVKEIKDELAEAASKTESSGYVLREVGKSTEAKSSFKAMFGGSK